MSRGRTASRWWRASESVAWIRWCGVCCQHPMHIITLHGPLPLISPSLTSALFITQIPPFHYSLSPSLRRMTGFSDKEEVAAGKDKVRAGAVGLGATGLSETLMSTGASPQ